jgi:hypothetical protein
MSKEKKPYDVNDDHSQDLTAEDMLDLIDGEDISNDGAIVKKSSPQGAIAGNNHYRDMSKRSTPGTTRGFPGGPIVKYTKEELRQMATGKKTESELEFEELDDVLEEEEDSLEEVSSTASVAGYQAPMGHDSKSKPGADKMMDDWDEVDGDYINDPNMKKSFKSSMAYKTSNKVKKESLDLYIKDIVIEELNEGFFSRLYAQAKGTKNSLSQYVKNVHASGQGRTEDIINPKFKKQATIAVSVVEGLRDSLKGKFEKYVVDLIKIFGNPDDYDMEESVKNNLNEIDQNITKLIDNLNELIENMQEQFKI